MRSGSRPVRDQYAEPRAQLVEHLRSKGINNEHVLKAIGTVPRELFVHPGFKHRAYEDCALPIGNNQTISQPYTVAFMTSRLHIHPGMKILEIGTGSGYQAAVLETLGAHVFSVERQQDLFEKTGKLFEDLGITVAMAYGDGTLGWAEYAPYDGIIVTAGAPFAPEPLKQQLAIGGRLVIPIGDEDSQTLHVFQRISQQKFSDMPYGDFKFVPLIGQEGWQM
ncbi:MAG TPA: protein-L-isoaspartate(D-aspartate) O-methyltransferase [Patescibacteria group bacterium]|nr:protein-L-isoaspartate(D-aspartate) O-methyltransferase [Patescibacteria group bacterium]